MFVCETCGTKHRKEKTAKGCSILDKREAIIKKCKNYTVMFDSAIHRHNPNADTADRFLAGFIIDQAINDPDWE